MRLDRQVYKYRRAVDLRTGTTQTPTSAPPRVGSTPLLYATGGFKGSQQVKTVFGKAKYPPAEYTHTGEHKIYAHLRFHPHEYAPGLASLQLTSTPAART